MRYSAMLLLAASYSGRFCTLNCDSSASARYSGRANSAGSIFAAAMIDSAAAMPLTVDCMRLSERP